MDDYYDTRYLTQSMIDAILETWSATDSDAQRTMDLERCTSEEVGEEPAVNR